ncbi:hypothetical protein DCS_06323 [Drechmeria coniospora]|uniref:Uncharacterized protein n=1 Tax=Drechmeria coniospora TaxID=98403 RepID=A0A151GBE5_DRECN|nr:hypothetical protein DCS_06323 [Drechmeria coniospora]KYK54365.1 hypothetical protein DCS_06323 [Drechmeria coniospora]
MAVTRLLPSMRAAWSTHRNLPLPLSSIRRLATASTASPLHHRSRKVVVVGCRQRRPRHQLPAAAADRHLAYHDVAVVDPAEWHHWQPEWTLVGGGLKSKDRLRHPLASLIDPSIRLHGNSADSFALGNSPTSPTATGSTTTSLSSPWALTPVFRTVHRLRKGRAPDDDVLAPNHWMRTSRSEAQGAEIQSHAGNGKPFQHELVTINGSTVTIARPDGQRVERRFDLLHILPWMGPRPFFRGSPLADKAVCVDVEDSTTRHGRRPQRLVRRQCRQVPTSKSAAAILSETPVLVRNLLRSIQGNEPDGVNPMPCTTDTHRAPLDRMREGIARRVQVRCRAQETLDPVAGSASCVRPPTGKALVPCVDYRSMIKGKWDGPNDGMNRPSGWKCPRALSHDGARRFTDYVMPSQSPPRTGAGTPRRR